MNQQPNCYIATNSIDYIFTDPPYADKVQYGELNFIWESWLGFDTSWHDEEIIVNEVRGKTEEDWADMMRQAMAECYRVLKPGRCISLCYHDTSEGTWALVQDIMAEAGFIVEKSDSALYIDTGQKSYNQLVADKVNKRDLVINFRKPKPGEVTAAITITGDEDQTTFNEKVRQIIRDYLGANPGSTKDRVYDEVVSWMVRSGRMEAHDFDELLGQVAEEAKEGRAKGEWDRAKGKGERAKDEQGERAKAKGQREQMKIVKEKNMVGSPSEEILDEAVRRILSVVKPRRIILFGSAACGNMGPHSDLDFLVVMPDGVHRRRTSQQIFRAMFDLDMPKDIIVVTESDVRDYGKNPSLVIAPALEEGRELYHA